MKIIPFNKPYISGDEMINIEQAVKNGHISGNGAFTKKCQAYFENQYGFQKCLLTNSCTDALEMAALLADVGPDDEVIVPSFTFTSTANAFMLRGAKIVFADCQKSNPNVDADHIEALVTERTRAIVVVHYAGVACQMDQIMNIANTNNLVVIEDAAQAVDSYYKGRPLGSIGHMGSFSFHETKNVICGEGGMIAINAPGYNERAEVVWEKGTNRAAFFRGQVAKYNWMGKGSSFLPSELNAAFLYAQLTNLEGIQQQRAHIWNLYRKGLQLLVDKGFIEVVEIPDYATNNYHMFYIVCSSHEVQFNLIQHLKLKGIIAVFHYLPLHDSPFFKPLYNGEDLIHAKKFSERIVRLPFYYELSDIDIENIVGEIHSFFQSYA